MSWSLVLGSAINLAAMFCINIIPSIDSGCVVISPVRRLHIFTYRARDSLDEALVTAFREIRNIDNHN